MMPAEKFAAASNQQSLGGAWPVSIDNLTAARAEALFASDLSQWASPAEAEVAAAIKHALRVFGGTSPQRRTAGPRDGSAQPGSR